jgi:hypothetical protein
MEFGREEGSNEGINNRRRKRRGFVVTVGEERCPVDWSEATRME